MIITQKSDGLVWVPTTIRAKNGHKWRNTLSRTPPGMATACCHGLFDPWRHFVTGACERVAVVQLASFAVCDGSSPCPTSIDSYLTLDALLKVYTSEGAYRTGVPDDVIEFHAELPLYCFDLLIVARLIGFVQPVQFLSNFVYLGGEMYELLLRGG
jgi:hypothetical protein